MTHLSQAPETDLWRIILFASSGKRLLALPTDGRWRLPTLTVPRFRRLAEHLTTALAAECSQKAVCLFRLDLDSDRSDLRFHVMESCEDSSAPSDGSQWVSISSLTDSQFADPLDLAAVQKALAVCPGRGALAKLGWFSDLTAWVREIAAREGLILRNHFSQLNADPPFGLIRFETNGPALWFKAVGEPNLREYRITRTISEYFPAFLPRLLAARDDCNGWIAMEARGAHPDQLSPRAPWEMIAEQLADLQIASLGRTLHLADVGCRDLRAASLAELVDPFFTVLAELMQLQTKPCPPPVSSQELLSLKDQLQRVLAHIQAGQVPNSLGHLDLNPRNIVVSPNRCTFLDWAEACIGHPFLTLQYLLAHLDRDGFLDPRSRGRIVSAYAARWKYFAEPAEIDQHLALAPLVAVFAYAVSIDAWRDPSLRRRPEVAKFLRSLARRMAREVNRSAISNASWSASCLR